MPQSQTYRPGDVEVLINGRPEILRLTLGALAEMEQRLGVDNLAGLALRIGHPSASDLLIILSTLTKAGGSVIEMAEADIDLSGALKSVADVFKFALNSEENNE